MDKRVLRWITIFLPAGFLIAIVALTDLAFGRSFTFFQLIILLTLAATSSTLFSTWVFRFLDQREIEIRKRANQLEALNESALTLTTELDLGVVLHQVVKLSSELVSARYGALGVLDEAGEHFDQFVTYGLSEGESAIIGKPPRGHGVFSVLIKDASPLKLKHISAHSQSVGFPQYHPPMESLLGVPIVSKGEVIGDLYLAEKELGNGKTGEFNDDDLLALEMFATQAAIAIDNARMYRQTERLAVLQERERFGMDLHDGIIQSIYAVGLNLDDIKRNVARNPESSQERIGRAILSLNEVIGDLRNYILDLRPNQFQGRNVVQGVEELARALRANTFMNVFVDTHNTVTDSLNPEDTVAVLHITQEALSNVRKHARASEVSIDISAHKSEFSLEIKDNGVSVPINAFETSAGNGLRNMNERASLLGGSLSVLPIEDGGTSVKLSFPYDSVL